MKVTPYTLNNCYSYALTFEGRFRVGRSRTLTKDFPEARDWAKRNCKGRTNIAWYQGWFELEEDLIAFRLRWE